VGKMSLQIFTVGFPKKNHCWMIIADISSIHVSIDRTSYFDRKWWLIFYFSWYL